MTRCRSLTTAALGAAMASGLALQAHAGGPTFFADLIVDGSACIGFDCAGGPGFGFDTLRLRENNTRLHFDDTSSTASFPSNDWSFQANDSTNGGDNYMAIVDRTAGRQVFRVDAGARSNALYVDRQGDMGLGTSTPAVDIDIKTGNTPTLRLQQDGTSGFPPQTWDVAGNEVGFFVRDVTSGSQLPLRVRTGAPSSSIDVASDGDVGIGTSSPDADLEISTSETFTFMRLTATGATFDSADITYTNGGGGELRYNIVDGDNQEMALDADGNLTIDGEITTSGSCSIGCDRVFTDGYEILPIDERMAMMWDRGHLPNVGPTPEHGPVNLSDKVLAMLNELEHAHIYIDQLNRRISVLERALADRD